MNTLQLVIKQMRERALGSALTLLSVLLGVALAVSILILRRGGEELFAQSDFGYDVLVGHAGSPLQLVLNTVYHLDKSPGNIPYSMYESLLRNPAAPSKPHPQVKLAVPFGVGDSYKGRRIVGTLPSLFGIDDEGKPAAPDDVFEYRIGKHYEFAQGRCFARARFEAVIGSEVADKLGMKVGDKFRATHGMPAPNEVPDIHDEFWEVVGILKPTHTANDRVLFIPLTSFYAISEHEETMDLLNKAQQGTVDLSRAGAQKKDEEKKHYTLDEDKNIILDLPKDEWLISSILVKTRSSYSAQVLMYAINNNPKAPAQAVNPASVMREFFNTFLQGSATVLLLVSLLVTVVAAVSILVSIYNSVSARRREIAILRALGATRAKVLALICIEAGLIGLMGGVIGFLVGHVLSAAGSVYLSKIVGEGIHWLSVGPEEVLYLAVVIVIAVLAGLVPAMKAYRTPVATNLVAG